MSTLLVINSSAIVEGSVSRQLVAEYVTAAQAAQPGLKVVTRDVGVAPLPHLLPETVGALRRGEATNDAERAARALSEAAIAELQAADTIIIGAPMYNFGITSTLKAWIDHVLRAGVTFQYTANGPEGLVKGKRIIIVETRGGFYSEGPAKAYDAQEPHLRAALGLMGLTDITFVRAEKLGLGEEPRNEAIKAASAEVRKLAAA